MKFVREWIRHSTQIYISVVRSHDQDEFICCFDDWYLLVTIKITHKINSNGFIVSGEWFHKKETST